MSCFAANGEGQEECGVDVGADVGHNSRETQQSCYQLGVVVDDSRNRKKMLQGAQWNGTLGGCVD